MTTKFEDVYLGVSPGENGLLTVYSRNYEDKRPSSLVVRDGRNTLVVVKEVPLNSGKSMITLALDAYDSINKHVDCVQDVAEPEGMNDAFDDRVYNFGVEYNRWTYG